MLRVGLSYRAYSTGPKKKQLVVLGTGWSSFRLARTVDQKLYDLHIVSPRNHFLFTPLLPSTTVGTLEFRAISEPIRESLPRVDYVQGNVSEIDTTNKIVRGHYIYGSRDEDEDEEVFPQFSIPYDTLVVGVGAVANTFGVPGVKEYCYFLKELSDARLIRNRIMECFERASNPTLDDAERRRLLHFVVVGGGPTCVEFTAELHDFLKQDVHSWFPELEDLVEITLLEAGKSLLSSFAEDLGEYTKSSFQKRKIEVRTGVAVKEVRRHEMVLGNGETVPFGLGVWSTGVTSSPLIASIGWPQDHGRVIVDECQRVLGLEDVFAIGDCSVNPNKPLPPTAQVAQQQGHHVAQLLNGTKGSAPFKYNYLGMFAYIGDKNALLDSPVVSTKGFTSWVAWNAAYLNMLVSWKNKIMIPMFWFKSFVFGRDVTRF